jgi:hypothetical protein
VSGSQGVAYGSLAASASGGSVGAGAPGSPRTDRSPTSGSSAAASAGPGYQGPSGGPVAGARPCSPSWPRRSDRETTPASASPGAGDQASPWRVQSTLAPGASADAETSATSASTDRSGDGRLLRKNFEMFWIYIHRRCFTR